MGGLSELAKKTHTEELGGEDYVFTELSIGDHIQLEKKYSSFDGDLLSLIQDPQTPTVEALSIVLFLMLQHEHEDITKEEIENIPARILPKIYREAVIAIYGGEGDVENPISVEEVEKKQTGDS